MKKKQWVLIDLFISGRLVTVITRNKAASAAVALSSLATVVFLLWKNTSFFMPDKKILFQVVDANGKLENAKPIQGALVTLQVSGQKAKQSQTAIDGRVDFTVKESDECTGLTVEKSGYDKNPVPYPDLIPQCFNISNTTIIPLRTTKKIPDPFPVKGADNSGKVATFNFTALLTKYAWALGKSDKLTEQSDSGDKLVNAESTIAEELSHLTFQQDIEKSKAIIAVGLSSCEGLEGEEVERAERRARTIKSALEKLKYKPDGDILTSILGQYKDGNCSSDKSSTALQRRLLIIRVTQQDLNVNLDEALSNAISKQEIQKWFLKYLLGNTSPLKTLDVEKYSNFVNIKVIP